MGSIGAIILFISVFLHELMHSVIALRYGIKVRQIILFIFGGVSEIPEETRDFRKEFKIAIAGLAASFAIAGALAVSWWEIMIPLEDLVVMLPSRGADEALMKMTRTRIGKVFVCDPQGVLLGLVSKTDIMNMASERQEFQQELKKLAANDSKAV